MPLFSSNGLLASARRKLRMAGIALSDTDRLYLDGASLVEDARYPEAVEMLSKVLARVPDDVDALERRATAYMMMDQNDRAAADLERAAALAPDSYDVRSTLCSLYCSSDPERALPHCDLALASDPEDAPTLNNRAEALTRLGRDSEAARDLDGAIALLPDEPIFRQNRAIARIEAGDLVGAEADIDHVGSPNDPSTLLALAQIAIARGDPAQARTLAGSVLRERPDHRDALCVDGLACLQDAREDSALASFDRALSTSEDGPPRPTWRVAWMALYGSGLARRRLGDADGAERDLREARAINPNADRIVAGWRLT